MAAVTTGTEPKRAAFTWRRTAGQALALDELSLWLKRKTGRPRIDHSEILDALVSTGTENPAVQEVLAAKLRLENE